MRVCEVGAGAARDVPQLRHLTDRPTSGAAGFTLVRWTRWGGPADPRVEGLRGGCGLSAASRC